MMDLSKDWNGCCQRCGERATSHTMSKFNTDLICLECADEEKRHPDYGRAVDTELAAIKRGDYNFKGIGWTGMAKTVGPDDGPADIFGDWHAC